MSKRMDYKVYMMSIPASQIENRTYNDNTSQKQKVPGWFLKIKSSIAEQGILDPIQVVANYDLITQEYHPGLVYSNSYGGNRLKAAYELNLDVPCIVTVYDDIDDVPGKVLYEVIEPEDVMTEFTNKPDYVQFASHHFYATYDRSSLEQIYETLAQDY